MEKKYHIVVTDREEGVVRDVETDAFCMIVDEGEVIGETCGFECEPETLLELAFASKRLAKSLTKEATKAFLEEFEKVANEEQSE